MPLTIYLTRAGTDAKTAYVRVTDNMNNRKRSYYNLASGNAANQPVELKETYAGSLSGDATIDVSRDRQGMDAGDFNTRLNRNVDNNEQVPITDANVP